MLNQQRATTTVEEAAAILGIGRNTAYAAIRNDTFPVSIIRIGTRYLIPRAALARLLEGKNEPVGQPDAPERQGAEMKEGTE